MLYQGRSIGGRAAAMQHERHKDTRWRCVSVLNTGLLLAAAVNRAQTVDHRGGMDADDGPRRKTLPDHVQRALVIAMSKHRNDDRGIADVKVRVAGRKSVLA